MKQLLPLHQAGAEVVAVAGVGAAEVVVAAAEAPPHQQQQQTS